MLSIIAIMLCFIDYYRGSSGSLILGLRFFGLKSGCCFECEKACKILASCMVCVKGISGYFNFLANAVS